jgi:hypothetical protein
LSEYGDVVPGDDRATLEDYMDAIYWEGGAMAAETLFIG